MAFVNPCEITAYVTAFANLLSGCCSEEELNILAVVFTQLGDTLTTISVYRNICCDNEETKLPE